MTRNSKPPPPKANIHGRNSLSPPRHWFFSDPSPPSLFQNMGLKVVLPEEKGADIVIDEKFIEKVSFCRTEETLTVSENQSFFFIFVFCFCFCLFGLFLFLLLLLLLFSLWNDSSKISIGTIFVAVVSFSRSNCFFYSQESTPQHGRSSTTDTLPENMDLLGSVWTRSVEFTQSPVYRLLIVFRKFVSKSSVTYRWQVFTSISVYLSCCYCYCIMRHLCTKSDF